MIPVTAVLGAVCDQLATTTGLSVARFATDQATIDAGATGGWSRWYVVAMSSGSTTETAAVNGGSLLDPHSDHLVRVRVTTVVVPLPGQQQMAGVDQLAHAAADLARACMLDFTAPITGDGWRVESRTHLSGPDPVPGDGEQQGQLNLVDDFEFLVVAT